MLVRDADLGDGRRRDVRVEGERVSAVGSGLNARDGETVYDADGRLLLPGAVDADPHHHEIHRNLQRDEPAKSEDVERAGDDRVRLVDLWNVLEKGDRRNDVADAVGRRRGDPERVKLSRTAAVRRVPSGPVART